MYPKNHFHLPIYPFKINHLQPTNPNISQKPPQFIQKTSTLLPKTNTAPNLPRQPIAKTTLTVLNSAFGSRPSALQPTAFGPTHLSKGIPMNRPPIISQFILTGELIASHKIKLRPPPVVPKPAAPVRPIKKSPPAPARSTQLTPDQLADLTRGCAASLREATPTSTTPHQETWKPIPNLSNNHYQASSLGRIRSVDHKSAMRKPTQFDLREQCKVALDLESGSVASTNLTPAAQRHGRILSQSGHPSPFVNLFEFGRTVRYSSAALITSTFIGPLPPYMRIYHRDGDRSNVALSNLFYGLDIGVIAPQPVSPEEVIQVIQDYLEGKPTTSHQEKPTASHPKISRSTLRKSLREYKTVLSIAEKIPKSLESVYGI